MRILILGGTAFLGREVAAAALAGGHDVTCLTRGTGAPAPGATLVVADRRTAGAYASVADRDWDAVVELTWDPAFATEAVAALHARAAHWIYVSSVSAYAHHGLPNADEDADLLPADAGAGPTVERYGHAKVACEEISATALGSRLLIVRPGLIGGLGDESGRSGYWVARAARDRQSPLLVPDTPDASTQVVDVRDLAAWLLRCAERGVTGTFDAVGPQVRFADWVELCRVAGGHQGAVRPADVDWLLGQGVEPFMGPRSMAMWVDERADYAGWSRRSGARAVEAGLAHRPRAQVVADVLGWEIEQGLERPRRAGLTTEEEADLLRQLGG